MKISGFTIILLGIALGAVILALGFFRYYSPNMAEAKNKQELYKALLDEANKSPQIKKRYEDAQKIRDESAAAWRAYVANNTPGPTLQTGGINLAVNPWQLAIDARTFRNKAQAAINNQCKKGGVTVVSGPTVPMPEESSTSLLANYFNFPAYEYPLVLWELGTVTVEGTYSQICANMKSWSNMRGFLAVADGLVLNGTSPRLTGTYNLVVVGFLRGNKFFGGINEDTASAGSAAGGSAAGSNPFAGMSGGPMGGSMGGPMGGPPMMGSAAGPRRGPMGAGG